MSMDANVFAGQKVYGDGWNETNRRDFNDFEKSMVEHAEAHMGDYGMSLCCYLRGGGKVYFGFSKACQSTVPEGMSFSLCDLSILTLERDGKTVIKVEPK